MSQKLTIDRSINYPRLYDKMKLEKKQKEIIIHFFSPSVIHLQLFRHMPESIVSDSKESKGESKKNRSC